ncbi:hypothetical protein BS17DRAFT_882862 [Gyrodon lividus]|nr:hypothetical protein BS17DRAFT_882862 [Gyrodon lividus]
MSGTSLAVEKSRVSLRVTVLFKQLVHMTFYTQKHSVISPRLRLLDASLEFDAKVVGTLKWASLNAHGGLRQSYLHLQGYPAEFGHLLDQANDLEFDETSPYERYVELFQDLYRQSGLSDADKSFDWAPVTAPSPGVLRE